MDEGGKATVNTRPRKVQNRLQKSVCGGESPNTLVTQIGTVFGQEKPSRLGSLKKKPWLDNSEPTPKPSVPCSARLTKRWPSGEKKVPTSSPARTKPFDFEPLRPLKH